MYLSLLVVHSSAIAAVCISVLFTRMFANVRPSAREYETKVFMFECLHVCGSCQRRGRHRKRMLQIIKHQSICAPCSEQSYDWRKSSRYHAWIRKHLKVTNRGLGRTSQSFHFVIVLRTACHLWFHVAMLHCSPLSSPLMLHKSRSAYSTSRPAVLFVNQ